MIVFLTLCYVGLLALAIKIGVIRLTLFWKLSPALWMVLLFVVLFLPMQWGAPGGNVNVYQYVIEIIPNVSGEVVEVPVKPLVPIKKGEVLFRIDPVPFQAKVDQLTAQLESTVQNVERLKAAAEAADATVLKTQEQVSVKEAEIAASAASVDVAVQDVKTAETTLDRNTKLVADAKVQEAAARRERDRQKQLLVQNAGSQSDTDKAELDLAAMVAQLNTAEADLLTAAQGVESAAASQRSAESLLKKAELELKQLVDAEMPRVKANAREAKIAAEATIDGEHVSIAEVRAQLEAAQFDLEQTVVRAPSDGHVTLLTLRPGQRVANFPVRSWMAFVDHEQTTVAVEVEQYAMRHIEVGQQAEVTFKMKPGRVFAGTVDRINRSTSDGQIQPSGQIVQGPQSASGQALGVVVKIDPDQGIEPNQLAGGARGSAAVYTDSVKGTHIIRRVMIRMDAWMNYLVP